MATQNGSMQPTAQSVVEQESVATLREIIQYINDTTDIIYSITLERYKFGRAFQTRCLDMKSVPKCSRKERRFYIAVSAITHQAYVDPLSHPETLSELGKMLLQIVATIEERFQELNEEQEYGSLEKEMLEELERLDSLARDVVHIPQVSIN